MISSNDFRPGVTIEYKDGVWQVIEAMHVKPGKGSAFVKTKLHIRIVFGRLGASIWPANRIVFGHPAAFNFGRPGALIWPANRTFLAA